MPDTLPHIGGLRRGKFERDREFLVIVDDSKGALPSGFDTLEHSRVFGKRGIFGVDGTDALDAQHHERILCRAIRKQVQPMIVETERIGVNPIAPGGCCPRGFVRHTTYPRFQEGWYEAVQDLVYLRRAIHFIVLRKREECFTELTALLEVMLQEGGDLLTGRVQAPQRRSVMHIGSK